MGSRASGALLEAGALWMRVLRGVVKFRQRHTRIAQPERSGVRDGCDVTFSSGAALAGNKVAADVCRSFASSMRAWNCEQMMKLQSYPR